MTSYKFEVAAKNAVITSVKEFHGEAFPIERLHLVWFAKVLKNKKAIIVDDGDNDRMYEVTLDGKTDKMYVDEYDKVYNRVFDKFDTSAHKHPELDEADDVMMG